MELDQVRCGNCNQVLDEPADLPVSERVPCPTCGSTKRTFSAHISVTAKARVAIGTSVERTRETVQKHTGAILLGGALLVAGIGTGLLHPLVGAGVAIGAFVVNLLYPTSTRRREVEREIHPPQ